MKRLGAIYFLAAFILSHVKMKLPLPGSNT